MTRVHIIGAGLAGLSCALALAKRNIPCSLISSLPSERAQSVLAEGGINAALDLMGEGDSPAEHFADTMRGGADLADPNAVAGMTEAAPGIVEALLALGVPFQREGGRMLQRNFGGQKKKRTAYARSGTGKALMTALIDETRRYEAAGLVERYPHHLFHSLLLQGGRCAGAIVRDAYTGAAYRFPGPVVLAAGGCGGLFPGLTTGSLLNTGDALAAVFSQGVELANPEFIQYHPTTVQIPGKRLLISEAARGEGGRLFTLQGEERRYFMEELYPELGNLMPRDVISREMVRLPGPAFLDLTGLPRAVWKRRLPELREELREFLGLDPARTPVPVSPGIHFFMGGLWVDEDHRTSLPGLYAAGECACQYHGANRLGGNSLLGAIYGGLRAARTAAAEDPVGDIPRPCDIGDDPAQGAAPVSGGIETLLAEAMGVIRDGPALQKALDRAALLPDTPRVRLGRAMLLCALMRCESRGAHSRADYPERDDLRFRRTTVAVYRGGEIVVSFRELPARREA